MGRVMVSMTKAKNALAEVVNQAAYGKERIILVSRGKPKAAIVSLEDLERLERLNAEGMRAKRMAALEEAQALREQILARTGGIPLSDSTEELRRLRKERLRELSGGLC